jgi:hypothetical protein
VSSHSAVIANDIVAVEAQAHFALEANRRLRVARLGVVGSSNGAVQTVWDAVVPGVVPVERVLPAAIDAVLFARLETGRELSALSDPQIAAAYLDHRFPVSSSEREDPALSMRRRARGDAGVGSSHQPKKGGRSHGSGATDH